MNKVSPWDAVPISPKRVPFFYGWLLLAVGALGVLMSFPGQTIGVSIFTDTLIEILNVSRMELSITYMFGTMLSAMFLPYAGKLYDRHGARLMTPIAAAALGSTIVVLSQIDHLMAFVWSLAPDYQFFLTLGTMIVIFAFLRFLGQGMMTVLSRNMVMKWFVRRRGFVSGALGVSVAVGFSALAYLLNLLVIEIGWSQTWLYTGVFIGLGFSVLAAVFYRDSPQSSGLLPDGDGAGTNPTQDDGELHQHASLSEAKKYFEFWMYAAAPAYAGLAVTAISFHIISVFAEAGYDRTAAVSVYLPSAVVSSICTIFFGWLSDKTRLCYLLRLLCAAHVCLALGLLSLETSLGYYAVIAGFGLSQAMFGLLLGLSWPRLFGVIHLGEISGFTMSLIVFGSAVGPLFFGVFFELFASYYYAKIICLFLASSLLLGSFRAKI